jgi:YggT family protein
MLTLAQLINFMLDLYIYVVVASIVVSWLIAFDVINIRNQQAANLVRLLDRLTDPVFKPLRKYIPPIGGIDITPIVVIFGIVIVQKLVWKLAIVMAVP